MKEIKITIPVICEDENTVSYAQYNWHPGKEFKQSKHAGSDHRFYINQNYFPKITLDKETMLFFISLITSQIQSMMNSIKFISFLNILRSMIN